MNKQALLAGYLLEKQGAFDENGQLTKEAVTGAGKLDIPRYLMSALGQKMSPLLEKVRSGVEPLTSKVKEMHSLGKAFGRQGLDIPRGTLSQKMINEIYKHPKTALGLGTLGLGGAGYSIYDALSGDDETSQAVQNLVEQQPELAPVIEQMAQEAAPAELPTEAISGEEGINWLPLLLGAGAAGGGMYGLSKLFGGSEEEEKKKKKM